MSDLRKDIVSGEWIIMAPERAARPHLIVPDRKPRKFPALGKCPFEETNLRATNQWPPIANFPSEKRWKVVIIPNKFPAVMHYQACSDVYQEGIYSVMGGIGHHDLVITRDHRKPFGELSFDDAFHVLRVFQKRYAVMAKDRCLLYATAFFNWGANAGASVAHPHYQILTLPIVPPDVAQSLQGSARYAKTHHRCVHCDMIRFEAKEKKRVIHEDSRSIALAPFTSFEPFEIRIFPKRHVPFFDRTPRETIASVARTLQYVLRKIKKNLNDVDLNFFVHSAPLRERTRYGHYHWHIEVRPKMTMPAGFELSTGVQINIIDPDKAAAILRT